MGKASTPWARGIIPFAVHEQRAGTGTGCATHMCSLWFEVSHRSQWNIPQNISYRIWTLHSASQWFSLLFVPSIINGQTYGPTDEWLAGQTYIFVMIYAGISITFPFTAIYLLVLESTHAFRSCFHPFWYYSSSQSHISPKLYFKSSFLQFLERNNICSTWGGTQSTLSDRPFVT